MYKVVKSNNRIPALIKTPLKYLKLTQEDILKMTYSAMKKVV